MEQRKWKIIFTCKSCLAPFTETIEAETSADAVNKLKAMIDQHGMKLKQITMIVQL